MKYTYNLYICWGEECFSLLGRLKMELNQPFSGVQGCYWLESAHTSEILVCNNTVITQIEVVGSVLDSSSVHLHDAPPMHQFSSRPWYRTDVTPVMTFQLRSP